MPQPPSRRVAAIALGGGTANAERAVPIPAAAQDVPKSPGTQTAVFAGGCFWGMEAVFEHVKGVPLGDRGLCRRHGRDRDL